MAIRFIPSSKNVILEGRDAHDKEVISLLKCLINRVNRVEKQLEILTEDEIDTDDGDII
jgi:hypothetical protein